MYQIDQSGKIEQTNKDTLLCLSNGSWDAVLIKASTKRSLQKWFKINNHIKNFTLFVFAAGLSFLIKRNMKARQILIDTEYSGKNDFIENIIMEILNSETRIPVLRFGFVGKSSSAHLLANQIVRRKKKVGLIITEEEIIKVLKKTELLKPGLIS